MRNGRKKVRNERKNVQTSAKKNVLNLNMCFEKNW